MKKNKVSEIILILLAFGLLLYLVYSKETKKEYKKDQIMPSGNVVTDEKWDDIKEFPEMDSNSKKVILSYDEASCDEEENKYCSEIDPLRKNKLSFDLNGIKISFDCTKSNGNECSNNKISIDSKVSFEFKNELEYEDTKTLIYKYNNIYVVKQVNTVYGQGILKIYSSDGKVLKDIKNSVTEIDILPSGEDEEMQSYKFEPVINNNRLYLVTSDYLNFEKGLDNIVHFGYIDLKNYEFNELYKTKGVVTLGV